MKNGENMINLKGIKHWIFAQPQAKPNGIKLLSKLTRREFNPWGPDKDYYLKSRAEYTADGLKLSVGPDKTVYFDWNNWKWSYEQMNDDDQIYTCSSGRADTKDKQVIDIYKPGRIISKTTTPQDGAVLSIWLYFEEHPWDPHKPDRDCYFELDIFEMEPSWPTKAAGMIFTDWLGHHHYDSHGKTTRMNRKLEGWHYPELSWDGQGRFTWKLDGVVMKRKHVKLPPKIKPYVIYSFYTKHKVTSEGIINWSIYQK